MMWAVLLQLQAPFIHD